MLSPGDMSLAVDAEAEAVAALECAVRLQFVAGVELLVGYGAPRDSVAAVFKDLVRDAAAVEATEDGMATAAALLGVRGGLPQSVLDDAVSTVFRDTPTGLPLPLALIGLVLAHGADPAAGAGLAFAVAAQRDNHAALDLLTTRCFDLDRATRAIVGGRCKTKAASCTGSASASDAQLWPVMAAATASTTTELQCLPSSGFLPRETCLVFFSTMAVTLASRWCRSRRRC